MPVQDLTPQLRTRLSRVERAVGWFVILATLMLLGGFGYYLYHTAKLKGWFLMKVPYHTYLKNGSGLRVGDPVRLMGFDVGEITVIEGTPAGKNWFTTYNYNVFVKFIVKEPYFGYVWTDSKIRIGTGDLLGKRVLEVTKGFDGEPTVLAGPPVMISNSKVTNDYVLLSKQMEGFWIREIEEAPSLMEHVDRIVTQVENALPGFYQLTNQLTGVLSNSVTLTARAGRLLEQTEPLVSHLTVITGQLTNANGSLGQWLIPTNLNFQLQQTLTNATSLLASADTNLTVLTLSLSQSLDNIANLTSNLNAQVEANDQILSEISSVVVQADSFVQGFRKHWLLRSAFKSTNEPARPARTNFNFKAGKHRD